MWKRFVEFLFANQEECFPEITSLNYNKTAFNSQSTSRLTSISKNEINIRIRLLCPAFEWNVEHFSGNLSEKDALTGKKIQNTWETIVILEILKAVMSRKIHSLISSKN